MDIALIEELRGWLMLILGVVGGTVGLLTYHRVQHQRRLENSFRMIQLFRDSIPKDDFKEWIELFHSVSEPAGANHGYFVFEGGQQIPFRALYSEGPPDNGAIDRISQIFDLVAEQALKRTLDLRIFYHEYGQLMDTIHSWLSTISEKKDGESLVKGLYPNFHCLYEKNKIPAGWNSRRYVYCR